MLNPLLNNRTIHEVVGRSLINVIGLGICAVLLAVAQKQLQHTSNDLLGPTQSHEVISE